MPLSCVGMGRPLDHSVQPRAREIYTVSRLNREAKALLEAHFPLVWVQGEVSNLARPASGHVYFSLKDGTAQIRCVLFRGQLQTLAATPRDGMHVIVRARVTLYEARGDFQLVVHYLEEAGEGALRRAFEALKARLAAEGLFDAARKRPLPRLPRRIGLVTSSSGAAVRDVLTTLRRRFPAVPVLLYPVPVQGAGAAERIAAALRLASQQKACDVLILARGGGSLEDLWAFNEEILARAIHDCRIPVVTGIGHEIDFTIADFVADRRAPTPTAAAELVSPDRAEWLNGLTAREQRLQRLIRERLCARQQQLDWLSTRLADPRERLARAHERLGKLGTRLRFAADARLDRLHATVLGLAHRLERRSPAARLASLSARCETADARLVRAVQARLQSLRARLEHLMQRAHDVSPLATLERGYAVVRLLPQRTVVRDAAQVAPNRRIEAMLHRGRLVCRVERAGPDSDWTLPVGPEKRP